MPRAVLFDLDGTLADTAPELEAAANALRGQRALAPLAQATIRPWVTQGTDAMLRVTLELGPDEPVPPAARSAFLGHYHARLGRCTRLFPTVAELLDAVEARGWQWGIVTNKPGWLTEPLVAALGLLPRAGCVVSGDSTAHAKPHPEPLLAAARMLRTAPGRCVYVGDAPTDVAAGRRAGMRTAAAVFGYLRADDDPRSWGADMLLHEPAELLAWLETLFPSASHPRHPR